MKYGDIVTYVRDGVESNALVYSHDAQSDAITLAFFDPALDSQGLKPAAATILRGVQKLGGNAKIGWKAYVSDDVHELDAIDAALARRPALDGYNSRFAKVCAACTRAGQADDLQHTNTILNEQIAQLKSAPSQADLDAHADEQKAKEATSNLSTPATDDLDAAEAKIEAEQPGLTGAAQEQMVVDEAASETAADPGEAQSDATGAEDCSITIPGGPISYYIPPEMAFVSTRGAADPGEQPTAEIEVQK